MQFVGDVPFREYTEASLDGTVYSAAVEEEVPRKKNPNSFFSSVGFMRIKIGFICHKSYEGGKKKKTAASVGMFKRILCFNAAAIRQEPRDASRISAGRSGGSSPDRFSYL